MILSFANVASLGGKVVNLRPKTPLALKILAGTQQSSNRIRLSDPNVFEVVTDTSNLTHIRPTPQREIKGLKANYVKAIISTLPQTLEMPRAVRLEQRKRLPQLVRGRPRSNIVRVREAILPEWLQKLHVYELAIDAPSIEVGEDATLFIDNDVSNLMCLNFHIRKGGRVVVQSPYFNLDIKGEFSGEMPGLSGMLLWTAVFRPCTEGEIQVYDWPLADLRSEYDKLWNEGMRLRSLRPYVLGDSVRWAAVWRPSNADEIQVYDWAYQDLRNKYDELWPQGWRVQILQPYVVNGQVLWAAVWRRSTEDEIQVYDWTYQDLRAKYDELWPQGWRLNLLKPYVVNGEARWAAVWRRSTADEIQVYDWPYNDFRAEYDKLWPQGWRLHILEPYVINNEVRWAAVWRRGSGSELQYYGWRYGDLRPEYDKLWVQGWRVDELIPYVMKG
jgi:hypothetical protein